jgi:hypothetical protein
MRVLPPLIVAGTLLSGCTDNPGVQEDRRTNLESIASAVRDQIPSVDRAFVITSDDCWSCMKLGRILRVAAQDTARLTVVVVPAADANAVGEFMTIEKASLEVMTLPVELRYDSWEMGGPVLIVMDNPAEYHVFHRRVVEVDAWWNSLNEEGT